MDDDARRDSMRGVDERERTDEERYAEMAMAAGAEQGSSGLWYMWAGGYYNDDVCWSFKSARDVCEYLGLI